MMNPMWMPLQQPQQMMGGLRVVPHMMMAGRPSAPDVSDAHPTESSTESQAHAQTEAASTSTMASMMQTMQGLGLAAAQKSHNAFLPPYSWMWKLGSLGLGAKYKKAKLVSDVPELLNMITGYYAGAPDALAAAQKVEARTHSSQDLLSVMAEPLMGSLLG